MITKLTLTIEKSVIDRAKSYAKATNRSLSELIQNYLAQITQETQANHLSPKLSKIAAKVKLPDDFNEEEELDSYFREKHS